MGKNISLNRNYISIKEQDVLTQLIVVVCKTSCFLYGVLCFYAIMAELVWYVLLPQFSERLCFRTVVW